MMTEVTDYRPSQAQPRCRPLSRQSLKLYRRKKPVQKTKSKILQLNSGATERRPRSFYVHLEGELIMKNAFIIANMAATLEKAGEQIEALARLTTEAENRGDAVCETYTTILLDELEHAQMLTLKLTELVTDALGEDEPQPAQNTDGEGGAFAQGELDSHGKDNTVQR